MSLRSRRAGSSYILLSILCLLLLLHWHHNHNQVLSLSAPDLSTDHHLSATNTKQKFDWHSRTLDNPVSSYLPLPKPSRRSVNNVQHRFEKESREASIVREQRRVAVKEAFARCWSAYRQYAWLQDELAPSSGGSKDAFGGWAATLVDSLDTLWIMDMKKEFAEAVDATMTIDFTDTKSGKISLFETNIRYLGGMLSAYDLSGDKRLIRKALELANTLWAAFDTPNRMPINWWDLHAAAEGAPQQAETSILSAEIGSLCMEFTHLAQLTGDPKWYDAVARIMYIFAEQQNSSNLPGMWPLAVNAYSEDFATGDSFTLGAMADSLYEYLPKMFALLAGNEMYADMYEKSMEAAVTHTLFRPMLPDNADVLIAGSVTASGSEPPRLEPSGQHLGCFVGGMLALGGRLIGNDTHVTLGRKVTDGCVWAYEHSILGIMPETFTMLPCSDRHNCEWDTKDWLRGVAHRVHVEDSEAGDIVDSQHLPQGFTSIGDRRYILRPEAIESVFVLYRITGDEKLQDKGWNMWQSIDNHTRTDLANSAIKDMTDPTAPKSDSMESFWTAETLKYFYLLFSPPTVISLDDFVFNTEAHPFRRPKRGWW